MSGIADASVWEELLTGCSTSDGQRSDLKRFVSRLGGSSVLFVDMDEQREDGWVKEGSVRTAAE